MPEVIKKIGIKSTSASASNIRDLGAEAQNVDVSYNSQGEIIEDITMPGVEVDSTQSVSKAIKDVIFDIDSHKETIATGTISGHVKIGDSLNIDNNGVVNVSYGSTGGTAVEGNDSRLSDDRKNPNPVVFSNGAFTPTTIQYDGSETEIITYNEIGASPKSHASTGTVYGSGTATNFGHVKLNDVYTTDTPTPSVNGASTGIGASAYAVQAGYKNLKDTKCNFSNIAPVENSTTSSKLYSKGKLFFLNGILYQTLTNIAPGTTFIFEGTNANAKQTTFEEAFGLFTSGSIWIETD